MKEVQIGNVKIGLGHRPFIVAEMSGNHNQSLERALEITEAAAKAGAHALKLQTFTADTLTLDVKNDEFVINDAESLWNGYALYDLYKIAYTPWEWHEPIMKRAKEFGMLCFSAPFDETAVDFLEKLDVPVYKIASFEINHLPLIRKAAATGKPIIISTAMATAADIDEAIRTARKEGCSDIIILKCTSAYPTDPKDSHVLTVPHMRKLFDCEVGLSDHTLGLGAALAAVAHGATIIEKHFTLSRKDGGVDSEFSLEPEEMRALVIESERARQSLGEVRYGSVVSERPSLMERRSLYIAADMNAGDIFTKENLRCIRPGFGLAPKYLNMFLGKKIARDAQKGTPMSWDLI